jgi:hypothetical protein
VAGGDDFFTPLATEQAAPAAKDAAKPSGDDFFTPLEPVKAGQAVPAPPGMLQGKPTGEDPAARNSAADIASVAKEVKNTTGLAVPPTAEGLTQATVKGGKVSLADHAEGAVREAMDRAKGMIPKNTIITSPQLGGKSAPEVNAPTSAKPETQPAGKGTWGQAQDQLAKLNEAAQSPVPRIASKARLDRDALVTDITNSLRSQGENKAAKVIEQAARQAKAAEVWHDLLTTPGILHADGTFDRAVLRDAILKAAQVGKIPKSLLPRIQAAAGLENLSAQDLPARAATTGNRAAQAIGGLAGGAAGHMLPIPGAVERRIAQAGPLAPRGAAHVATPAVRALLEQLGILPAPEGREQLKLNPLTLARQAQDLIGTGIGKLGQYDPVDMGRLIASQVTRGHIGAPAPRVDNATAKRYGDLARDVAEAYALPISKAAGVVGMLLRAGGLGAITALQEILNPAGTTPSNVVKQGLIGAGLGAAGEAISTVAGRIGRAGRLAEQNTKTVINTIRDTSGLEIPKSGGALLDATMPGSKGSVALLEHADEVASKALREVPPATPVRSDQLIRPGRPGTAQPRPGSTAAQPGMQPGGQSTLVQALTRLNELTRSIRTGSPQTAQKAIQARDSLVQDIRASLDRAGLRDEAKAFVKAQSQAKAAEVWHDILSTPGVVNDAGIINPVEYTKIVKQAIQEGRIPKEMVPQLKGTMLPPGAIRGKSTVRKMTEHVVGSVGGGIVGAKIGHPYTGMILGREALAAAPGPAARVGLGGIVAPAGRLATAGPLAARVASPALADILRTEPDQGGD